MYLTVVSLNSHFCNCTGITPVHWFLSVVEKVKLPNTVLATRHGMKTRSSFISLTLVHSWEGAMQLRWKCSPCLVPRLAPWTAPTAFYRIVLKSIYQQLLNFASWSHSEPVCSAFRMTVLKDWLFQGVLLSHLLLPPLADGCSQTFEVWVLLSFLSCHQAPLLPRWDGESWRLKFFLLDS